MKDSEGNYDLHRQGSMAQGFKWTGMASAILFLSALGTHADTGLEAWVQRYQEMDSPQTTASAIALDGASGVIVTGTARVGGIYRYATIKYSSAGQPLWTNRFSGAAASAVAVDGNDNVIVTGAPGATAFDYTWSTIKYSSAGVPLWTNRFTRGGNASANAIAVDTNGNVFVTGGSSTSTGSSDYTTIKYSSTGLPVWTNRYTRLNYNSFANRVFVDAGGNVIVMGGSVPSSGSPMIYTTIKYSNAGVPLWTNNYFGGSLSSLALDGNSNVILAGSWWVNSTNTEFTTIKYSASGVPLWTNRYGARPENPRDQARAVAVDASGNVFVTGQSPANSNGPDNYDYATIKYSSAGQPLWTNRYDGPAHSDELAQAIAVDCKGNVFVTGYSCGSATNSDYVTIKYSNGGVPLWTNRLSGRSNPNWIYWRTSLAIGPDGAAYVAGTSSTLIPGQGYEFATVKYISGPQLQSLVGAGTTNITVIWTAVPGQAYQLQCNTDVSQNEWLAVTNIVATDAAVSVSVSTPSEGSHRFYRVLSP